MKSALLIAVVLAGCATSSGPPSKTVAQYYQEALDRHYAGVEKWKKGWNESSKCLELVKTNPDGVRPCLNQLPPAETFLPVDRKKDEGLLEYMERKNDEWDEKDCFYQGLMQARYLGENQRIEDQCKRDLEIKRLRKAVEKLNRQNQR